jgi:hypothetical protein
MIKLSELNDDIEICNGNGAYYTVAEIKHEIIKYKEDFSDWRIYGKWFIAEPAKWEPDAKGMIERYIDSEYDEMYEDWDQRIWSCFNEEDFEKIQSILDEVVKRDNGVTNYYNFGKEVEIDILPNK